MRWLWFLLPVLVLLIGAGFLTRFGKRRPALSDEERREQRIRSRHSYFTSRAIQGLVITAVAGIGSLVVGRWQIGLPMLVVGGVMVATLWHTRNTAPRE